MKKFLKQKSKQTIELFSSISFKIVFLNTIFFSFLFLFISYYMYFSISKGYKTSPYTVTAFFNDIGLGIFLWTFFSVLICTFVVKYCLYPVRSFSQKMYNISANNLNKRINIDNCPKELKSLVVDFNHMIAKLEGSFAQMSQFSSDVAHELRNSINNLIVITEVTLSKPRTVQEYVHTLAINLEEYTHLAKMIDSMLFLAKIDHTKISLDYTRFFVLEELTKIKEFFDVIAEENEIEINVTGNCELQADKTLFYRAISNILCNAVKYTPPKGKITLNIEKNNHFIKIKVHNTGSYIPPEHIEKIFNRFYRIDASRQKRTEGSGLGLAITSAILKLHYGKIYVESSIVDGTMFILSFPLQ